MSPANIAAFSAAAQQSGTSAAQLVSTCQDSIDHPEWFTDRGGADGDTWPGAAMKCAFAYRVTANAAYLTQALKYWKAALEDDQTLDDGLGCKASVNLDWSAWDGNPPAPPVIITVTHDTGYPMRWYGPYVALTYDWLHDAPGVPSGLLDQTRQCLTAWVDYYTERGYHHDEPGANYNAGYVAGKALTAIAIGNDSGSDGHLWTEAVDTMVQGDIIGKGLAGADGAFGTPAGPLVGGDWAEGWQYGPLSVLEYAVVARALEENGVALPELDAWTNSLIVRYIHGTVPAMDGHWPGGDFDNEQVYCSPPANLIDAVLAGPSSDEAAAFAAAMRDAQGISAGGYFYNALAALRSVTPVDYRTQTPAPALWTLARGTSTLYARTSWDASAFWTVFSSPPRVVSDHQHMSASNFAFTRGADHLIVDPSTYGDRGTLSSNAVTADSTVVIGDYVPSQTPWSEADLPWARGTADGVYAARSDFAKAFIFSDTPSDIPYAHREWVMLPEGEIVTIDRVRTGDASRKMYVRFHTNTAGALQLAGTTATGAVGGSSVAIHQVLASGGTASVTQTPVGDCFSVPFGGCTAARFPVDEYDLDVPGPYAVAIHVIDGLGATEAAATVGSLNDDTYDPAPKQNAGVVGAAVYRSSKQSYVVASSAQDGASPATMTYGVPATAPSRHVVFDAPESADGQSVVTATAQGDRCVISITAGTGFTGHPLMFEVASSTDACTVTESTDVAPGEPPPGGGVGGAANNGGAGNTAGSAGSGGSGKSDGGCGCQTERGMAHGAGAIIALLALVTTRRRRKGRAAA